MVVLTFVACASIGYAMCAIVSSVLDSIVATIFVCFAEVGLSLWLAARETGGRAELNAMWLGFAWMPPLTVGPRGAAARAPGGTRSSGRGVEPPQARAAHVPFAIRVIVTQSAVRCSSDLVKYARNLNEAGAADSAASASLSIALFVFLVHLLA